MNTFENLIVDLRKSWEVNEKSITYSILKVDDTSNLGKVYKLLEEPTEEPTITKDTVVCRVSVSDRVQDMGINEFYRISIDLIFGDGILRIDGGCFSNSDTRKFTDVENAVEALKNKGIGIVYAEKWFDLKEKHKDMNR